MEEEELQVQSKDQRETAVNTQEKEPAIPQSRENIRLQHVEGDSCPTCGKTEGGTTASPSYIYAIGKVDIRFPSIEIEKEFAQATGRENTKGLTDRQTLHSVLSEKHNHYLLRNLCWVMTIQGIPTYILLPRDPADYNLLLDAIRPVPSPLDIDVVIGMRGPNARPEICNGLQVPMLVIDQMYSFDRESLLKSIPKPAKVSAKDFAPAAEQILSMIMQMTDNAGSTDDNRALNYLAVRYPAIYSSAYDAFARNASLSDVEVRTSTLSSVRNILKVIFSYTNRQTGVTEKFSVDVDATGMYPFLLNKLSPFFDH